MAWLCWQRISSAPYFAAHLVAELKSMTLQLVVAVTRLFSLKSGAGLLPALVHCLLTTLRNAGT